MKAKAKAKTWSEFIKDVERDENGHPVALSRWGWKKETINGKKYLVAAPQADVQQRGPSRKRPSALA